MSDRPEELIKMERTKELNKMEDAEEFIKMALIIDLFKLN